MATRLTESATVQTLLAFLAVFLVSQPLKFLFPPLFVGLFALHTPVALNPWSLVTSVYSHLGVWHLVANSVVLALVGIPIERSTPNWAFHAFFAVTGALAGLSQVWIGGLFGAGVPVMGASGAIFALLGYLIAGNRVTTGVLDRFDVPSKVQIAAFAAVALGLTWFTAGPGVAVVAHLTGLVLGLVAGRAGLLPGRARRSRPTPRRR